MDSVDASLRLNALLEPWLPRFETSTFHYRALLTPYGAFRIPQGASRTTPNQPPWRPLCFEGVCSNSRDPCHPARVLGRVRPAIADTRSGEFAESADEFRIVQNPFVCFTVKASPDAPPKQKKQNLYFFEEFGPPEATTPLNRGSKNPRASTFEDFDPPEATMPLNRGLKIQDLQLLKISARWMQRRSAIEA